MSLLWVVPAAVVLAGALPALVWAMRAGREARGLREELARWSALRPVMVEVRTDAEVVRERLRELRHR